MPEKVSIITISFNAQNTIEHTFKSVINQAYRPLEYVLVDGGSTDGTIELINRYISKFEESGIEVSFRSEPDRGISDAFNKGILRATGSIIGIINSDDQLENEAVSKIVNTFDDDTDVVCGDCLWVDQEHNLKYVRKSNLELDKLRYCMVLMHPTCFVKKRSYEKYGIFDLSLKYVMDKDLMARFYRKGAKFKYCPMLIATMSAGGVSDANINKVFEEGIIVAKRNGVPEWKAKMRVQYSKIKMKFLKLTKRNMFIWKIIMKVKRSKLDGQIM